MTKEEKDRQYRKEWYEKNKSTILAKRKIYREKNREEILNYQRSDKAKANQRGWRRKNRDKALRTAAIWRNANREKIKGYNKKFRETNLDKRRAYDSAWKRANRKLVSSREKKRKKQDLNFSIKERLRSRVWHSVNRQSGKKAKVTMELIGCTIAAFRKHIESRFRPGMTWENIHLDHIMPCANFDLTKPEDQRRCFHFSNYRPLFPHENISRGNKMTLADWAMLT